MLYRAWSHLAGLSLGLVLMLSGATVQAASTSWDQAPVDRLIVKFKPHARSVAGRALRDKTQIPALQRMENRRHVRGELYRGIANGAHVVKLAQAQQREQLALLMQELQADPDVEYVEPDLRISPALTPNDTYYEYLWSLQELAGGIRADKAWDITLGTGAVVAVLDTGIRPHVDLQANILPGYDFVSDEFMGNDGDERDSDPSDPGDAVSANDCAVGIPAKDTVSSWHGTHVAGTIAAEGFNGLGVIGVAPQAGLLPLRVMGRCGGYSSDLVDAIYWAAGYAVEGVPANQHPARVINMSLSSTEKSSCGQVFADAITQARAAGAVVVIAAGNSSANADLYPPGNCSDAITVAATNRSGARASYSNYGDVVDLAAPGGQVQYTGDNSAILSTGNSGSQSPGSDIYVFKQGTSMATPHVSGVAALLMAVNPAAQPAEVEAVLRATARAFPASCSGCGAGIVDADSAVRQMIGFSEPDQAADLVLAMTGATGKYVADENNSGQGTIRYIITITNSGEAKATAVVLENIFPTAVTPDSITLSQGNCSADGVLCELGDLAVNGKATVTIVVRTTSKSKMLFQGQTQSAVYDPSLDNNFAAKSMGGSWSLLSLAMLALVSARRRSQRFQQA